MAIMMDAHGPHPVELLQPVREVLVVDELPRKLHQQRLERVPELLHTRPGVRPLRVVQDVELRNRSDVAAEKDGETDLLAVSRVRETNASNQGQPLGEDWRGLLSHQHETSDCQYRTPISLIGT
jgi:hypothetical protein